MLKQLLMFRQKHLLTFKNLLLLLIWHRTKRTANNLIQMFLIMDILFWNAKQDVMMRPFSRGAMMSIPAAPFWNILRPVSCIGFRRIEAFANHNPRENAGKTALSPAKKPPCSAPIFPAPANRHAAANTFLIRKEGDPPDCCALSRRSLWGCLRSLWRRCSRTLGSRLRRRRRHWIWKVVSKKLPIKRLAARRKRLTITTTATRINCSTDDNELGVGGGMGPYVV